MKFQIEPKTESLTKSQLKPMIVSLTMYDFPELRHHTAALWHAIYDRLAQAVPTAATIPSSLRAITDDFATSWHDPQLLLGQTCGWPLLKNLKNEVRLVATPHYDFLGCKGPQHRSFIVARRSSPQRQLIDFKGTRAALNSWESNSGMNLFRATIAPLALGEKFFRELIITGSHQKSIEAITQGMADIAAIDCVSFGYLARLKPELTDALRIITPTIATPALPFIISRQLAAQWLAPLRAALTDVLADPNLADLRQTLGLAGLSFLPRQRYYRLTHLADQAKKLGYPTLA